MKKTIFIYLLLLALFNTINAQIPGTPKNLLSPNAASLGLYGEVPVSFYTGTPNINIPLYDLNYGGITVPISLSYQASGVQPDQHPGWVGLGWTLNTGGIISRTIKDLPDEYNNSNRGLEVNGSRFYFGEKGFYYSHNQINNTWTNISSNILNNLFVYDTEPDEFSFNFLGINGHFYLDPNGVWQVECDKPIKVELNSTPFIGFPTNLYVNNTESCANTGTSTTNYKNNTKAFSGFKIIDDKGIVYIFGNNNNAIEYSISFFNQNSDEWFANSWMLTKIILPTSEEINFEYQRDNFINQMSLNINYNIQTSASNGASACTSSSIGLLSDYYDGFLISPVYLASINTPGSRIIFDRSKTKELRYTNNVYNKYDKWIDNSGPLHNNRYFPFINGWKPFSKGLNPVTYAYDTNFPPNEIDSIEQNIQWYKLDHFRILNSNNGLIKSFQFNYSQSINRRLTLYSLEEKSNFGTNGDVYSFNYYNMEKLPPYLSFMTDHWGFFNNRQASLPTTADYSTYYNSREATTDADIASAGSLKEIIYPTGGKSEFIYESHKCYKQVKTDRWNGIENIVNGNKYIGGIRIKTIRDYHGDNPSDFTEKNYYYVSNYTNTTNIETANSSGILGGQIKYYFDNYTAKTRNSGNYSKYIFSSQSILPMSINSQGCHVGYSEVTEMSQDGSYRKLFYTNFGVKGDNINNCDDEIFDNTNQNNSSLSPYFPHNSRKIERGKLMLVENNNQNGTSKSIKRYIYKRINPNDSFVQALRLNSSKVCDANVNDIYGNTINTSDVIYDEAIKYKIYTYSYLPESEIETVYGTNSSEPFTITKTYNYKPNKLLSSQSINNSKNEIITTNYSYVSDYQFPSESTDANLKALILMNSPSVHMINYPIEIVTKITQNNVDYVSGSTLFLYKSTDTSIPFIKLWSENNLAITDKVNNFNPLSITANSSTLSYDNRYIEKIRYNKYDEHGNPQFITKNQTENTVYLWSYNYQYPIAEVRNATWTDIVGTPTNSGIFTETQITNLSKSNNLSDSDWTTINTLYNLTNANTTLYRYLPLIGLINKRNPNGANIYYQLDIWGHLSNTYMLDENNNKKILKSFMYQTTNKEN